MGKSLKYAIGCMLALLGLVGVWAYSSLTTWRWNDRITLVLRTPDGDRRFETVVGESLTLTGGFLVPSEAAGARRGLRGEAMVVEILPDKYLFVLLENMPSALDLFRTSEKLLPVEKAAWLKKATSESIQLSPSQYPIMAAFVNLDDPSSVRQITSANIARFFDSSVSISSMQMSITKDRISSQNVGTLLPWLSRYSDKMLDGNKYQRLGATATFANSLNTLAFRRR